MIVLEQTALPCMRSSLLENVTESYDPVIILFQIPCIETYLTVSKILTAYYGALHM